MGSDFLYFIKAARTRAARAADSAAPSALCSLGARAAGLNAGRLARIDHRAA
jgi:hypothetical protein